VCVCVCVCVFSGEGGWVGGWKGGSGLCWEIRGLSRQLAKEEEHKEKKKRKTSEYQTARQLDRGKNRKEKKGVSVLGNGKNHMPGRRSRGMSAEGRMECQHAADTATTQC
jgi:hypothetical protein